MTNSERRSSRTKNYDEVNPPWDYDASASKVYNEAVASALKAYNKALFRSRGSGVVYGSEDYVEVIASASKAYKEALASALKAYNAAVFRPRGSGVIDVQRHLRTSSRGKVSSVRDHQRRR